jgi:hypothetical protein
MFTKTSRYAEVPTVVVQDGEGREVTAVKLRRLPDTLGAPHVVRMNDQLDVISERLYRDGTRYWHVADANTELEAAALTAVSQRVIKLPRS